MAGVPIVERSNPPGLVLRLFIINKRRALPMVMLARNPGPKRFSPEFMPILSAIAPLTRIARAAPPVLVAIP